LGWITRNDMVSYQMVILCELYWAPHSRNLRKHDLSNFNINSSSGAW